MVIKAIVHSLPPLAGAKRVFCGFVPIICAEFDGSKLKIIRVSSKNLYLPIGVPGVVSFIKVRNTQLDKRGLRELALMIEAGLSLSDLQLAFPIVNGVYDVDFDESLVDRCDIPLDIVLRLIRPIVLTGICHERSQQPSMPHSNDSPVSTGVVELRYSDKHVEDELRKLIDFANSLKEGCGSALRRFLRATHLFSLAVSQTDYIAWIILLNASVEALSSTIKAYLDCFEKAAKLDFNSLRNRLVKAYGLEIDGYSIRDLRNAIVHGECEKRDLDLIKAGEIIYGHVIEIEKQLSSRGMRKALREFLESPALAMGKIVD